MDDRKIDRGAHEAPEGPSVRLARLRHQIEHAAHLLPAQGPITVFVHHNTLHAFEDRDFADAVAQGARLFGCRPYLSEDRYRQKLARGRFRPEDLSAVLLEDLGDEADVLIGFMGTRFHLRLAMLQYPMWIAPAAELRWFVTETDALRNFRAEVPDAVRIRLIDETRHWVMRDLQPDTDGTLRASPPSQSQGPDNALSGALGLFDVTSVEHWDDDTWEAVYLQMLWHLCRHGVQHAGAGSLPQPHVVRHRDLLLAATGEDSDALIADVLIGLCAAFLDQGLATWSLPHRNAGLFRAFLEFCLPAGGPPNRWLRGLRREVTRIASAGLGPLDSIDESLRLLGVTDDEQAVFVAQTLLALRGWAGMIWQMETRGDRAARPAPPGSLVEFLAVRLVIERCAVACIAREAMAYDGPLSTLRDTIRARLRCGQPAHCDQRAFTLFQMAQLQGWKPRDLAGLTAREWRTLADDVGSFTDLERRRIYHLAFERRYRIQTLDALAVHARHTADASPGAKFQVVCCIDEREESFRRHLEELAPQCETFGVAGFFAVAMYYRGAADAHFVPLCPVLIQPRHYVQERVVYTLQEAHRSRTETRRALARATHRVHLGSRTLIGGLLAALLGSLASIPLVARVLFPRLTAQVRRTFGRFVQPPPATRLELERSEPTPGPENGHLGFSVEEMAGIVERVLRDIGLTTKLANLVVIMGHGSSSLNNPHESAHDCGACGGGRGGPNARAFAQMANDVRVRDWLGKRGLHLSPDVVFLGAYHNTCDDAITCFDLDDLPSSHIALYEEVKQLLDAARARNAHERCRRFESAPLSLSPVAALRHVEGRSEDLAQPRPEYGHATNAVCLVARRSRTRGLFLDRRAFLHSYDPFQDDASHSVLTRILQAVVPVCGGINLEYYFSYVDPTGWGCGTKLPHNIAALLGVMDGAASDLRPGLPWQMVEIHEPVRLLLVVETTPQALRQILDSDQSIGRMCRNKWIQLATLDPQGSSISVFDGSRFLPYVPESAALPEREWSVDWYRGWRDHLGPAVVRRGADLNRNASLAAMPVDQGFPDRTSRTSPSTRRMA